MRGGLRASGEKHRERTQKSQREGNKKKERRVTKTVGTPTGKMTKKRKEL